MRVRETEIERARRKEEGSRKGEKKRKKKRLELCEREKHSDCYSRTPAIQSDKQIKNQKTWRVAGLCDVALSIFVA